MISLGYSVFLVITKISGTKEKPGTGTKEKPGTEPNSNTIIHAWFECMAASPPMSTVGGLQGILSCMLFRNTVYGVCSCTTITAISILTLTLTGNRCVNRKSVYQYEIINLLSTKP